MIEYIHVLRAVNIVNGWLPINQELSPMVKQLAESLQIYKTRGDFNGTLISAIECLELAEYEMHHVRKSIIENQFKQF